MYNFILMQISFNDSNTSLCSASVEIPTMRELVNHGATPRAPTLGTGKSNYTNKVMSVRSMTDQTGLIPDCKSGIF